MQAGGPGSLGTLRLREVELEGKSVLGEALAFALGGNARMLRAGSLAGLVHDSAAAPVRAAAAEVVVRFDIVAAAEGGEGEGVRANPVAAPSGSEGDSRGAPLGEHLGTLSVRRRVTRVGRSELALQRMGRTGLSGGATSRGGWRPATAEDVRAALAPFGIQTDAIDRLIHRQAVNVQHPVRLARFLELLIGTAGYEEEVARAEAALEERGATFDAAEGAADALELRRRQLAPEACEAAALELEARKSEALTQEAALLDRQLTALADEAAAAEQAVVATAAAQEAARGEADALLAKKTAAEAKLAAATQKRQRLGKQAERLLREAARLRVRLQAAQEAAAQAGSAQQQRLQLQQADEEVVRLKSALAGKSSTLSSLAADEAASSARVQELRAARPGGDSAAALQQRMEAAAREAAGAAAALVSRETAHQQSHSRLEGLQQDSVRLAAAIEKNQAKQRQVEEQIAALMQQAAAQQREVAQADAAAIERLQRLCRAEAAVQEARAALSAMETQLAHRASADSSAAGGGPGPRGSQSVDEAVAVLAEASAAGRLPGALHGRLHSVAQLAHPAAGTAVNAVLCELVNMVGVATVRILSELRDSGGGGQGPHSRARLDAFLSPSASGAGSDLLPLLCCVEAAPGVAGVRGLLASLLASWHLAPNRQAALAAVQADRSAGGRRHSIVTLEGELFKADGEMVGSREAPAHLRPYLLTAELAPAGGRGASSAAAAEVAAADAAALRQQAAATSAQLEQLCEQERAAAAETAAAAQMLARMREEQRGSAAALAAAQRRLQRLTKDRQGKLHTGKARTEQALATARQDTAAAHAELAEAAVAKEQAEGRLLRLREQYQAAVSPLQGGAKLLAAERELEALASQRAGAAEAVAEAEAALAAARRRQQRAHAVAAAAEAAAGQAAQLCREVAVREEAAEEKRGEARELGEAVQEVQGRLGALTTQWRAAIRRHEASTRQGERQVARLREVRGTQWRKQAALAGSQDVLAALEAARAQRRQELQGACEEEEEVAQASPKAKGDHADAGMPAREGTESSDSEADAPARQRRRLGPAAGSRRRPAQAAASKQAAELEDSSSGEEEEAGRGGRAASVRQRSQQRSTARPGRRQQTPADSGSSDSSDFEASRPAPRLPGMSIRAGAGAAAAGGRGRGAGRVRRGAGGSSAAGAGSWSEEQVEEALAEVARREGELEAARRAIDTAALEGDMHTAQQLQQVAGEWAGMRVTGMPYGEWAGMRVTGMPYGEGESVPVARRADQQPELGWA
eukprot:scaffold15.g4313.t1